MILQQAKDSVATPSQYIIGAIERHDRQLQAEAARLSRLAELDAEATTTEPMSGVQPTPTPSPGAEGNQFNTDDLDDDDLDGNDSTMDGLTDERRDSKHDLAKPRNPTPPPKLDEDTTMVSPDTHHDDSPRQLPGDVTGAASTDDGNGAPSSHGATPPFDPNEDEGTPTPHAGDEDEDIPMPQAPDEDEDTPMPPVPESEDGTVRRNPN